MRLWRWCIAVLLTLVICGVLTTVGRAQQPSAPTETEHGYVVGDTQAIGDGVVSSWVYVDGDHPSALGVTFSEAALSHLPEANTQYLLRLPETAEHAPFDHFALDWNPHGHFPEQFYGAPHFDFHFYLISPEMQRQITGTGADEARILKPPAAPYLPEGYVPAAPGVAHMGLHWVRPEFHEFHGQPFTESFLFGSYNGRLAFLEPMITLAFFQSRPAKVDSPVPQTRTVQQSGYYPTRYTIAYDPVRHTYTVALEGLTYRKADRRGGY